MHLLGGRCAENFEDFTDLSFRVLPLEKWTHFHHLSDDTTSSPHIDLFIIKRLAKDKLRSSVVARADVRYGGIVVIDFLCRTEITKSQSIFVLFD